MPRDGRPTELPLAIAKASRGSELTKLTFSTFRQFLSAANDWTFGVRFCR